MDGNRELDSVQDEHIQELKPKQEQKAGPGQMIKVCTNMSVIRGSDYVKSTNRN